MQRRVTDLTGPYPKPAAAIKLGYASRSHGLGYLENGLTTLRDEFTEHELLVILRLLSDISQLSLKRSGEPSVNELIFPSSADTQLNLIKFPSLVTCLDDSSIANGAYGKWYRLGVAWGECACHSEQIAEVFLLPDCCDRFTKACRQLTEAELDAFSPCKLWIEHWKSGAIPQQVLSVIFTKLPPELCNCAAKFPQSGPFSDFLHFILAAAELARLPESSVPPVAEETEQNIFRRNGAVWEIRFKGGKTHHLRHLDGLLYISELLRQPTTSPTAELLYAVKTNFERQPERRVGAVNEAISAEHSGYAGDLLLDETARRQIESELHLTEEQLSKAIRDNDPASIDRLRNDKEIIIQQLSSATGLGGRSVKISPEQKKIHDKVCNAINRAIEKIEAEDRSLFQHLLNCIDHSGLFTYSPEESLDWSTD